MFCLAWIAAILALTFALPGSAAAASCDQLSSLTLPAAVVTKADSVPSGGFRLPGTDEAISSLPAFCRLRLTATPTVDSNIDIEIWMPLSGWTGRLLGTGGGGYAGSIAYSGLVSGLRSGYAVVTSNMGTAPPSGDKGAPHLVGHPERWSDFGWRSTHLTTVLAKRIVEVFYGRVPDHSYFSGCSTGGMQGLREAQEFPEDYDGILAGAPGSNRARLHVAILWNYAAAQKSPDAALSPSDLELVHQSVLRSCGPTNTAVASDPFLIDPRSCPWTPDALRCSGTRSDGDACLNDDQLSTVRALYQGPRNPRTREPIFPGLERGSELGWSAYMPPRVSVGEMPWRGVFEWIFGSGWDWKTFDYDQDVTTFETVLKPFFVATSPELSLFRRRGGKLLLYTGWADWLSAPEDTIDYYKSLVDTVGEGEALPDREMALTSTQDFARLFLFPGMSHCGGGAGPSAFEGLTALVNWVERANAPERLVATQVTESAEAMRRPVCVYPKIARYSGAGDMHSSGSYECVAGAR
jgi:Tannase and feruloyl esterase